MPFKIYILEIVRACTSLLLLSLSLLSADIFCVCELWSVPFYFTSINHTFLGVVSDLVLNNGSMVKQYKDREQAFVLTE